MDCPVTYAYMTRPDKKGYCVVRYITGMNSYTTKLKINSLGNGYVHVYSVHDNEPGLKPFMLLRATLLESLPVEKKAIEIAEILNKKRI